MKDADIIENTPPAFRSKILRLVSTFLIWQPPSSHGNRLPRVATAFLIWQPPSSYGNHLPNMATAFLIWQVAAFFVRDLAADATIMDVVLVLMMQVVVVAVLLLVLVLVLVVVPLVLVLVLVRVLALADVGSDVQEPELGRDDATTASAGKWIHHDDGRASLLWTRSKPAVRTLRQHGVKD